MPSRLVLITSCQVFEKRKNGPDSAQITITKQQLINVIGWPVARAARSAMRPKKLETFISVPNQRAILADSAEI